MLVELRVENYAVIDNAAVEFASGLNILTGETGAGKSILIDALALLLGEKASAEVVRHGAEKAVISAVFEGDEKAIASVLVANGLESDSEQLILKREISAGGKGRVFVNNQPAMVAVLRQLAPLLAAVHAQNESILAFDAEARLELLDAFARIDSDAVRATFERWRDARARLEDLERGEQDRLRMVDLWSFQKKEIDAARPEAGEDERLETEKRVLANAEKIYSLAMSTYELLYESEASAAARLRSAARNLQQLATYEARFEEPAAMLDSARLMAEDVGATLRDYAAGIDASPARLAAVEDRLASLDLLKRKYGPALEQVLAYRDDVTRKLDEVENRDEVLRQLRAELAAAAKAYLEAARKTSATRRTAAAKLERAVESEVNDLAMKASFKVAIEGGEETDHWTAAGFDCVAYLISTNPGEPLKPVERIASGGELSRVMLALKATVEAGGARKRETQRTLIFDEIDSGIGGRAAEAVGKKLKALARSHQVLCITHLPQIASFADHHYVIEKKQAAGRTRTGIRRLSTEERTEEVARMLSGAKLSDTSRKHAEQMLKANA